MTAPPDVLAQADVETPAPRRRGLVVGAIAVLVLVLVAFLILRPESKDSATPRPTPSPSPSATPLTAAEIYSTVAPSVVTIESLDAQKKATGSGTGVVVSDQ